MKLLVFTQKVDAADPVLGFFHGWLLELGTRFEKITVVALGVGVHHLPPHISTYSLGKEKGVSKATYIARFYTYVWALRSDYDAVLVHMNPEYVVMGGLFWRIFKKKVLLWYNHPQGNAWVRVARIFSQHILHTSPFAYAKRYKNSIQMPAGIDTDRFIRDPHVARSGNSFLSLGRISKIKHVDVIVDAYALLRREKTPGALTVYGDPDPGGEQYYETIKRRAGDLSDDKLIFHSAVRNDVLPEIFSQYQFFINATTTGSFDKAILEGMACEVIPIVSNKSFEAVLPKDLLFHEGDKVDLARALEAALLMPDDTREVLGRTLREYVVAHHSLRLLGKRLQALIG